MPAKEKGKLSLFAGFAAPLMFENVYDRGIDQSEELFFTGGGDVGGCASIAGDPAGGRDCYCVE
jgi:hypothetical protein